MSNAAVRTRTGSSDGVGRRPAIARFVLTTFTGNELRVNAKKKNHEEEDDGPEMRHRHQTDGFRVNDKGKSWSTRHDLFNGDIRFDAHETQHGKDNEATEDIGQDTRPSGDHDIAIEIVVRSIVTRQSRNDAPTDSVRPKDVS